MTVVTYWEGKERWEGKSLSIMCVCVCVYVCVYRFKPVDVGRLIAPLEQHFQKLFSKTFDTQKNELFVRSIKVSFDIYTCRW